jgi:hypothetical protein
MEVNPIYKASINTDHEYWVNKVCVRKANIIADLTFLLHVSFMFRDITDATTINKLNEYWRFRLNFGLGLEFKSCTWYLFKIPT